MDKKKYAFLLMGEDLVPAMHHAVFETEKYIYYICTVKNAEEAKTRARILYEGGVRAIELCGAFGSGLAREISELTNGEVATGYVVHEKEQDSLFAQFFGG